MRKPRQGEYFVFHDDPKYLIKVIAVSEDQVTYQRADLPIHECNQLIGGIRHFNEFHTRVPI